MTTIRLTGWTKGLRTVSLVQAVKEYATGSLKDAKSAVDDLLEGRSVTLVIPDDARREEFRRLATELGAIVE
jgi:hypothetical protein